jgi:NAD(P)-dependent dehydrogenase (short-subunit alcohol dehydrogenase family)
MVRPGPGERPLSGRRVVITGATRGLGRALAIIAADQGAELVLMGRDSGKLPPVADTILRRTGREAATVPCDISQPDSIREACARTLALSPVVDVLINNAAPWLPGKFEDLTEVDITSTVAAGATGTMLVTRELLPGLRRSEAADIVTIVSTAALPGQNEGEASAAFHAAKHAQSGFSDKLRAELKGNGIRVTAIYPPDFDDTDPLDPEWSEIRQPGAHGRLTNREVVGAVLFAITAPRVCAYPVIVLDNMWRE